MREFIDIVETATDDKQVRFEFENELDNSITITIDDTTEDGEPRVIISMEGPDSLTENVITRMEAKELLKALDAFLNK